MAKVRQTVMWAVLILIALLILFSLRGAFLGAERAQLFFHSIPLLVYWIAFFVALVIGIVLFKRLLRSPGLLMIHLGCIAVLFGAMWGSEKGHHIQETIFGTNKNKSGTIIIYEGLKENQVLKKSIDVQFAVRDEKLVFLVDNKPLKEDDERIFTLPFEIKLNDFRMEYYDSPRLIVRSSDGAISVLESLEIGEEYDLGENTWLTVKEIYKNYKLRKNDNMVEAYDEEGPGVNPAVRTSIRYPDDTVEEQTTFANYPGISEKTSRFSLQYQDKWNIRDYFSDVLVIDKGNIVKSKSIQVNDPLHYGGYHFYQQNYDQQEGQYTVLSVESDSGLYIVYLGYALLMIGIIWQMWVITLFKQRNNRLIKKDENHGA
jgi:cytochrome c biogenesis protein ResB